mgnify:CR=1 FL=1
MASMTDSEIQAVDDSESDEELTVEVVSDGGGAAKPRKRRRLKCFVVYHGDRATRMLPHSVKVKCPRDGSWETGAAGPRLLRAAFVKRYNEVHPNRPLVFDQTKLLDQFGSTVCGRAVASTPSVCILASTGRGLGRAGPLRGARRRAARARDPRAQAGRAAHAQLRPQGARERVGPRRAARAPRRSVCERTPPRPALSRAVHRRRPAWGVELEDLRL